MKKTILYFKYIVILAVFLSGCKAYHPDNIKDSSSNIKTDFNEEAPLTLKLLFYYEGQERVTLINKICNDFNFKEKSVIIPQFVPYQDLKKKLLTDFAKGEKPDIVIFDKSDYAYLADLGILQDITVSIKMWPDFNKFFNSSIKACEYNSKIYGLPVGENCLELFYNKQLLGKHNLNPPETWEELKESAKNLTSQNVKGMAISAQNNEQGMFQFLPWLYSSGATMEKLDSTEAIKAFKFLSLLIEDGSMSKEVINWSQADIMNQFAKGEVAMMINGPWQITELKLKAPNLQYGVVHIPKDKKSVTVLGGENIGIVNDENKDEALEFIKYFCSVEIVKTFSKSIGYFPSRKDVPVGEVLTGPDVKVFSEDVHIAVSRGLDPKWPEKSRIVIEALYKVLLNTQSPESAAKEAQNNIETILGKK